MTIRKMTIDDYEAVRALWQECGGIGLSARDDSRDGIRRFLERNPRTCFVAEQDGMLAGTILCGHDGRRAHIYHAAVGTSFRRQGIAHALAERVCAALAGEGIAKAALVVFADNADGNAFWESCGFSVRGDLTYRDRVIATK